MQEADEMEQEKIRELVGQLSLEEKAGLTSGQDNWFTKAVERLGIPAVRTSDGPNGLRTQEGDTNGLSEELSREAVCFPTASASAASFDTELETIRMMGQRMNVDAAGNDGVATLMSQSLGILYNFLPQEKKETLDALINELNEVTNK